jgi:hypothetical protein
VVIWSSSRVLLHERISDTAIEILDPAGASIVGTRGALGYREDPRADFADRQFVVWTDTQVFNVVPIGPIIVIVTEVFLPGLRSSCPTGTPLWKVSEASPPTRS